MKHKPSKDLQPAPDSQLRATLDANGSVLLVVDREARILFANRAAARMLGAEPQVLLRRVCGDVLHCLHTKDPSGSCDSSDKCKVCGIRTSVEAAARGEAVMTQEFPMSLQTPQGLRDARFLINATPFDFDGVRAVLLSLEDVTAMVEKRRAETASWGRPGPA